MNLPAVTHCTKGSNVYNTYRPTWLEETNSDGHAKSPTGIGNDKLDLYKFTEDHFTVQKRSVLTHTVFFLSLSLLLPF